MPFKFSFFLIVISSVLLFSCPADLQVEESSSTDQKNTDRKVTAKDIASIEYTEYALSDAAEVVTTDWLKFIELNNQVELLKQGDLSFFSDDLTLLTGFLNDLIAEIPEKINEPSIIVRLIALKTTIYKLEGSAKLEKETKDALLNSIRDVLIAHTNLIFQINKKLEKDAQDIRKPRQ